MAQSLIKEEKKNLPQKPTKFRQYVNDEVVMKGITDTLGSTTRSKQFVAALISNVNNNSTLQKCDFGSIVNAAFLGESLKLSPSSQLGYYYIIPYNNKKWNPEKRQREDNYVAQFQLGYKGYIQLAMRSGLFKKIVYAVVKKGELKEYDRFNGTIKFQQIIDEEEREKTETAGYYVKFELLNGYTQFLYWSKKEALIHADKYSKAFSLEDAKKVWAGEVDEKDMWKYSSPYYTQFDFMSIKNVIRNLFSKFAPMSPEMEKAFIADSSEITDYKSDGSFENDYIDNDANPLRVENTPEKEEVNQEVVDQPEDYNVETGEVNEPEKEEEPTPAKTKEKKKPSLFDSFQ